MPIVLLTLENLFDINEEIKKDAAKDKIIILLQAFPDVNHRTALTAVEVFLNKNNIDLDYTPEEAYLLRKECNGSRLRIYGTYEEMPVSILNENDNDLFKLCKEFIQNHIEQLSKFY